MDDLYPYVYTVVEGKWDGVYFNCLSAFQTATLRNITFVYFIAEQFSMACYYMAVSQGLGTRKYTNLIGCN